MSSPPFVMTYFYSKSLTGCCGELFVKHANTRLILTEWVFRSFVMFILKLCFVVLFNS